jgi:hypothetical protein
MDETSLNKNRLSDRILYALKLSIDQGDTILSDTLVTALELSMTRNAGGKEFTERRTYSPEIEAELTKLSSIKK